MRIGATVPVLATLFAALVAGPAHAGYFGAARYQSCGCAEAADYGCARQHCHVVMRTCRRIVWEKQQYTCYKTVYETVYDERTVECVKYVRETRYRECTYTVCKPVWETRYRECTFTMCKPVWETR